MGSGFIQALMAHESPEELSTGKHAKTRLNHWDSYWCSALYV